MFGYIYHSNHSMCHPPQDIDQVSQLVGTRLQPKYQFVCISSTTLLTFEFDYLLRNFQNSLKVLSHNVTQPPFNHILSPSTIQSIALPTTM